MVELKFKDVKSLNAVTTALHENGYKYSTFIVWKKDNGGIDYFTVQIEGDEDGKIIKALGVDVAEVVRCKDCKHCTPDENIVGGYGDCFYKDDIHSIVNADDFCSLGEREGNG